MSFIPASLLRHRDPRQVESGASDPIGASSVGPPFVRRRNRGALVLHGNPAEWIVLALWKAIPVVRHQDAGERWMPVEDDAEHVVGFSFLPVRPGIHGRHRRHVWVLEAG